MEEVQLGKRTMEEVLNEAEATLGRILEQFKEREEAIGEELVAGLRGYWREREEIGLCPKCGEGTLVIIRSPKTGKRFIGCSRYKEGGCDATFPLPQKGTITPLKKKCEYCGYQMIRISRGKRGWETCINWAQCPGRQDQLKRLRERQRQEETKEGDNSE